MEFTTVKLAMARDVSEALLEGLELDATSVHTADQLMTGASEDREKEEQLLEFLRRELSACKRI